MRVLCYNINTGTRGRISRPWRYLSSDTGTLEEISSRIREGGPDIFGIVEIDRGSFRTPDQAEVLAPPGYSYVSACKYGRARSLPILRHQHLAIFTKHGIGRTREHRFSAGFKRLALECVVETGEMKVSVIVTHLSLGRRTRERQLQELDGIVEEIERPVVLMGDFNSEGVSIGEMKSCVEGDTYPARDPDRQLDYIFVRGLDPSGGEVPEWQLSDHLPVIADAEP